MPERRLTLLRHAKSDQDGSPDHGRVLAARGRRQCPQVAEHLRETGRLPQLVLCSTATRTRQTWELVAAALREATPQLQFLDSLYAAEVTDVLDAITGVPDDVLDLLVVGHDPATSETASYLAGPGSDAGALTIARLGVPTASLSLLQTEVPWADLGPATATLTAVLTSPHS